MRNYLIRWSHQHYVGRRWTVWADWWPVRNGNWALKVWRRRLASTGAHIGPLLVARDVGDR